mmetsp:Transcript_20624/g.26593  ORF Transcript_20624/g.26593 Transcript_20624/m.26593 type:complete len:475 (-) Transcript_20624:228-1652(-)
MKLNSNNPSVLLLFLLTAGAVHARRCGTLITDECKSIWDERYDTNVPTDLTRGQPAWQRIGGFFTGVIYTYDVEDAYSKSEVTPDNQILYPTYTFLNITVSGTRVYRHKHLFRFGIAAPSSSVANFRQGYQAQCDSVAIATWEKDGIAKNLRTICSDDSAESSEELEEGSMAYPIDDFGITFEEILKPKPSNEDEDDFSSVAFADTFKCNSAACPKITVIEEQFESSKRVSFEIAEMSRVSEEEFIALVNEAPYEYFAGEDDNVPVPTNTGCLNEREDRCHTDRIICGAGDPSDFCLKNYPAQYDKTPYEDEDEDVKPGVVAALVIFSVLFVMFVIFVVYLIARINQTVRSRYFFARRMLETMKVDKSLDKFTAEDVASEYQRLKDKVGRDNDDGEIDEDSMYEFLSTGELGYMGWGDFGVLWATLDRTGSGAVSFLEFCSYMGHCWKEFNEVKNDGVGHEENGGDVPQEETEE